MKCTALCIQGLEDACVFEIKSLGGKKTVKRNGAVLFDVNSYETLSKIAFFTRTASRIFTLMFESKIEKDLKKCVETAKKVFDADEFLKWADKDSTFKVECKRRGKHDFNSADFEAGFGKEIIDAVEKKKGFRQKVEMDSPDLIIFCSIIDNELIGGVDFCGFDLSKREYHIFTNKISIRGTLGASLLFLTKIKKGDVVLDPMSNTGEIAIEAALFSKGVSPHLYRKDKYIFNKLKRVKISDFKTEKELGLKVYGFDHLLANIKSSQKNAKIAGVKKGDISFSRTESSWLDTKFDESSVDFIVTRLPSKSKTKSLKDVEKTYKELFYQSDYIIKNNGSIIVLVRDDEPIVAIAKKYKFKASINDIFVGKMPAKVIVFKK